MLGVPTDPAPAIDPAEEAGARSRPTGTSESDDGVISSFHPDHPSRPADDPARFGDTCERLDYIFSFPGVLYGQHIASSRIVVEQWTPGRDMSDHYGVEATIDTTTQSLPAERPIQGVNVTLAAFHCLQTTSGPGSDEVAFTVTVRSDSATIGGLETGELEDVEAGTAHGFDGLS
jgi:hypothetical protein